MKKHLVLCIFVFCLISLAFNLWAQIPQTLSYQGVLKDAGGVKVPDGDYQLTFNLYTVVSGGTSIWTEVQTLTVTDGIFNAILGSVTPLNAAFDVPYWLGVTVESSAELPRIRLTSSAYSLNARTVVDNAITTTKIADEAVTQAKLDPGVSLPPGGEAGGDLTGNYPNPAIAENAVNSDKIQDGTIQLTDLSFTPISRPLSPGVASDEIADNAVTTTKINNGAVTQAKIAPGVTLPPSGTAGGDLASNYPNPTVDGIQGRAVASTAPASGQVLKWNGTSWSPAADDSGGPPSGTAGGDLTGTYPNPTIAANAVTTTKINDGAVTQAKLAPGVSLPPEGTAGGDLGGTYPNPVVDGLQGRAVSSTLPTSGQVLKWNGSSWIPGTDDSGGAPSGSAGGDLSGTYPNPTVDGLQGRAVSSTLPTAGQVLEWNGSSWIPGTDDSGGAPSGSAGGDLSGTYPNPTVDGLQGRAVSSTLPTAGQVLEWNGSSWIPGTDDSGGAPSGPAGGDLTGTYPNPTVAANAITSSKIQDLQVASADLANLAVTTGKIADGAVTQAKIGAGVTLPPSGTAGGDLSGTYPNPTVDGLQGRAVSSTLPTAGQVLEWNGSSWIPGTDDSGGAPSGPAGGDLTGTYPNPTVAANAITSSKIQDLQVASADLANLAVTTGKIADGAVTQAKIGAGVTLPPSGTAGGDLSGTYPNPTVDGLQGRAVSSTLPTSGQVLEWNGSSWIPGTDDSGGAPSGPAGGDLTGTYPNPTVAANAITSSKIQDLQVASADLANLAVNTGKIADGAVTQAKIGAGVTLPPSGTAGGDLTGTYPSPTVDGLQNRAVASTAPTSGQVLKWNGSSWAPGNDDAGTSVWATSGNDIYNTNTNNVGIGITGPTSKLHVSGSSTGNVAVFRNSASAGTGVAISVAGSESPTALVLGTTNGAGTVSGTSLDFEGYQSSVAARTSGRISGFLTTPSSGTEGALTFHTRSSGVLTERMRIEGDGDIILTPYNVISTSRPIYHNYSGSSNSLSAYGSTSLAVYYIQNSYAGAGYGLSAGMSSSSASSSSYGVYGFNYGTGYGVYGRNYNSGGIGARGINNSSGNYGDLGTASYGIYGYHNTGNYGYVGSSSYGVFGYHNAGNYGYLGGSGYGSYSYLATTNVGNYAVYGYGVHSDNVNGTGYGPYNTLGGVQGYCWYGNPYTFGVAGYSYLDDDRSGGCLGSNYGGTVWGAMAYQASGIEYGGYFTSFFVVPGDDQRVSTKIGLGSWGDLLGADIHGRIYGLYTEGHNYASYSNGATFKNNLDVHLQDTQSNNMAVLYTNVSTDVTVQTSGFSRLSNGEAMIPFDENFKNVVSSEVPIVVTVTPMGECRGVYVARVDRNGFRVVESNNGESSVQVSFIAIGRRAGYERPHLPPEVIASDYVDKLSRGLHNEGDTQTKGEGLYYENGQLFTGIHSSTLPTSKPSQDPDMIKMAVPEKSRPTAPQGDGAGPEAEQRRQQQR